MRKIYILLILFLILVNFNLDAQNIAITDDDTYSANSSAMLDVKSTTKGVLIPRIRTTVRLAMSNPATGLLVFDSDIGSFYYYNGADWVNLTSGNPNNILGYTAPDKVYLNDINDKFGIGTTAPTNKLDVKADASNGVNQAIFNVVNQDGDTIFAVYPYGVRINVLDDTTQLRSSTTKGGFAVGGYNRGVRGLTNEYLRVTPDSVRIYIEEGDLTRASTTKGGFAVGGYNREVRGNNSDYFNIYGSTTASTIDSEPRIFWYPLKEAFLAGRVHVGDPDSVGTNSFASGYNSIAMGNWSQALGYQTKAFGDYSTAIGKNAVASSLNSFAFGDGAKALNQDAYAFGAFTEARGVGSFAFGYVGRDSLGPTGHVTKAIGDYSFAFGLGSQAVEEGSFAFGAEDSARGKYSVAIGYKNIADSWYATALGYRTKAYWGSFSAGFLTNASGIYSTAFGYKTTASDEYAIAMGCRSNASNRYTVAIGVEAIASGDFSTSIGMQTTASGDNSFALGYMTNATAGMSMAFGALNTASGDASTVFGAFNTASGDISTAFGMYSTSQAYASFVLGQYNLISGTKNSWVTTEPLFVIGNGTSSSDRSNAITVLKNGKTGIGISTPSYMLHVVDEQVSNDSPAIYGVHAVTDNYGVGVQGYAKYKGVYGIASTASGTGYGIYGTASGTGTGTRYGVYGYASGGDKTWAGYFSGNAYASTLYIGTTTQNSHRFTVTSSGTGAASSTAAILNTASAGLALTVENSSTSSNDNVVLVTQKGSTGDIMSLDSYHGTGSWDREFRFTNSGDGRCDGSWYSGGADYAEFFPKADLKKTFEPGDVMIISGKGYAVEASKSSYSDFVLGVYSINPAIVGNSSAEEDPENSVLVGLLGVIPTKVCIENGPINVGDFITTSSINGVAMKATKPGMIIGRALESYNDSGVAKIKVMVSPMWSGRNLENK